MSPPITRSLALFALLASLVAVPGLVQADEASDKARALELFQQGKDAYREGKMAESIQLLQDAYALYPEPVLLYNLARAHEGRGDFEQAVEAYELYLDKAKEVPDRGAIERKIASLKETLAERARLAAERDRAVAEGKKSEPVRREPASASAAPWIIAGVGVATLSAGAALGALALGKNDDASVAGSQRETVLLRAEAEDLALASTTSFIVGGVVTGGALVWGVIDVALLSDGESEPRVSVHVAGPSLWIEGKF